MNVLASGRFDPPHCGHIRSLQLLGQKYDLVIVVVLDHEGQRYAPQYRAQILEELLEASNGNYEVIINKDHFAKIKKAAIEKYGEFVYASGNLECLMHVGSMGYKTIYIDRAYDYEASEDRKLRKIKDALQ